MNTYQLSIVAISIWAGTLCPRHPWVGATLLLISMIATWASWGHAWQFMPILAIVGLITGGLVATAAIHRIGTSALLSHAHAKSVLTIEVQLRDDPGDYGTPAIIETATEDPRLSGEPIWVQGPVTGYAGSVIEVRGPIEVPANGFGAYLQSRGISAIIRGPTRYIRDPTTWWDRSTAAVHQRVAQATQHLVRTHAGLLLGLALGDERLISDPDASAMRDAGLSHLTAVSGSNVAVVAGAILALGWLLALGRQVTRGLTLLGIWWLVWLVRGDASVVRAAIMASLIISATMLGRPAHLPHSLAVTVLGALLINPLIGQQLGFALSVAASAGVLTGIYLTGVLIGQGQPRILTWMSQTIGASIGAALFTTPVLMAYGLDVQPASAWANVMVAPIAMIAQWGALTTTALAMINTTVASWVATITTYPIRLLLSMAHGFGDPVHYTLFVGLNTLVISWVLIGFANRMIGRYLAYHTAMGTFTGPVMSRSMLVINMACLILALRFFPLQLLPQRLFTPPKINQAQFIALDVGQGDALLVGDPQAGWILIDTGPDPKTIIRHLYERGINRLNAVIITHAHSDHTGGLDAILRTTTCAQVMVSAPHVEAKAPRTIDVHTITTKHKVPITHLGKGDHISLGQVRLEVLHPSRTQRGLDPNDASIVLMITGPRGVRVLATGDAEAQAQWAMANTNATCDVLKVPHHGGDTNARGFLTKTGASMAIISCGINNDYGHPHQAVLAELATMRVHRTDRDGTCTIAI